MRPPSAKRACAQPSGFTATPQIRGVHPRDRGANALKWRDHATMRLPASSRRCKPAPDDTQDVDFEFEVYGQPQRKEHDVHVTRKLIAPAIAAAALGLSSIALIGAAPLPASAAVAQTATHATRTVGSVSPDAGSGWKTVGQYGSYELCFEEGINFYTPLDIVFRCPEINIGEPYFLWYLEVDLPGN
jgi:hypothetical protein